jgi:hypothetical protein
MGPKGMGLDGLRIFYEKMVTYALVLLAEMEMLILLCQLTLRDYDLMSSRSFHMSLIGSQKKLSD